MFHDLALVHHHDAVGEHVDHGEVVRDEQACEADFGLQLLEQFQHLRLHRHIQRGGRFVGDEQARLQRQRACQGGALALAAGQLVRETVHVGARKLHHLKQIAHILAGV